MGILSCFSSGAKVIPVTNDELEGSSPASTKDSFWKKWGEAIVVVIVLSVFMGLYAFLLVISIQQGDSARNAPDSYLNNPRPSDHGWDTTMVKVPGGLFGPLLVNGTVQRNETVRLEVKYSQFTPQSTGGVATVNLRLVLPDSWMNQDKNPSTPLWSTSCSFGNAVITVTPASFGSNAFDASVSDFAVPMGTKLQYPLDKYRTTVTAYCYYYSDTNAGIEPPDNYLNFKLAMDTSDVGFFTTQMKYTKASAENITITYDDDSVAEKQSDGSTKPLKETIPILLLPEFDFVFYRPIINIVFPLYILLAMWLVVTAETLVFFPFYAQAKNVDAVGVVTGSVAILFALPSVRNTMPDPPDVGAIIDFAAYFWCLIIAIAHFFCTAVLWVRFTVVLAPKPAVQTTAAGGGATNMIKVIEAKEVKVGKIDLKEAKVIEVVPCK